MYDNASQVHKMQFKGCSDLQSTSVLSDLIIIWQLQGEMNTSKGALRKHLPIEHNVLTDLII